jgi:hypothetical protein
MPSRLDTRKIFQVLAYKGDENYVDTQRYTASQWLGFCPDIRSELLGWGAGISSRFIARGETLVPDRGCFLTNTYLFGEDSGANKAGEGVSASADFPQSILFIDNWVRETQTDLILVTAKDSSTTNAHIFRRDGITFTWTEVEPRGGWGAVALTDAANAFRATTSDILDGCSFSPGAPSMGGGAGGVQDVYILCSGSHAEVLFFQINTAGTAVDRYDYLINSTVDPFKAYSVVNFFGRACYWNVVETTAGPVTTSYPLRLRHSVVGDPLDLTGAGSGYIDADEMSGAGVCVRQAGDVILAFATNGIAMFRRTLDTLAPLEIEYVSRSRGIWGPGCLCPWGEGVHFGIFTDGMFFIDSRGQFQEIGTSQLGQGNSARKWHNTFYGIVNKSQANLIRCIPDAFDNVIRIFFPTGDSTSNDSCWIYDVQGDRMWPDADYTPSTGYATAGVSTLATESTVTLGSLSGGLGSYSGTLASYINYGVLPTTVYGTATGALYEVSRSVYTRPDSAGTLIEPVCWYSSNAHDLGDPITYKIAEHLVVDYYNQASATEIGVSLVYITDQGSVTNDSILTPPTNSVESGLFHSYPNLVGRRIKYELAVTGSAAIKSVTLEYSIATGDADTVV